MHFILTPFLFYSIKMNNSTTTLGNITSIGKSICTSGNNPDVALVVKIAIYIITMAVSLCGNLLVVCVVYRNRRLRTPTNFLITNMAVSDFMVTVISMAPLIHAYLINNFTWYSGWFGLVSCKLIIFCQGTTTAASIFTLTAIAFERFNAIVFPLRSIRSRSSLWAILGVWFLSCVVMSPMLFAMTTVQKGTKTYCLEVWKPPFDPENSSAIYTIALFILLYALPLSVISLLYACVVYTVWLRRIPGNINRSIRKLQRKVRKNVIKMLITVVLVFAIFWLPINVLTILHYVSKYFKDCRPPAKLYLTAFILSHATGAVNFLVYVAFSEDYKQGFKSLCYCLIGGVKSPMRPGQPSVRTEHTTDNRRSTSQSKKTQDIELKKLTSNADLEERSTPRANKNVKFDMEYSSSV